jgi:hypothetical protein
LATAASGATWENAVADRGIRSLVHLQNSASTARVLNLLSVWRRHKDTPEYSQNPFFQNSRLNRALILKHRLRRDERDLFDRPRLTATKVVFPVDPYDLKMGGQFAFVGQKHFSRLLEDAFGRNEKNDSLDMQLLNLLDQLPSLDPYLMREELKRAGYRPAPCYLELSEGDLDRIFTFVQEEIEPLIRMSLGGQIGLASQTTKLATKILSNTLDSEMEPLRLVLRLNENEFAEGVFCWKGFLYYKWVNQQTVAEAPRIVDHIIQIQPLGKLDAPSRERIEAMRTALTSHFLTASDAIKSSLATYDTAYEELTKKANPTAFRDFLLTSPAYFAELGERLGVLQHVVSFWRFRFPPNQFVSVSGEELFDIFTDFQANLQAQERQPDTPRAYV